MTGGQIAALIFGLLLLVPGGCFLFFGIGLMGEPHMSDGATVMLTGTYELQSDVSQRLLRALPPLLVLRAQELDDEVILILVGHEPAGH